MAVAYISDGDGEYIVEPAPAETGPGVDTTGAGDAFATGFLYGFLRGKGLEDCGSLGNIVAQFSVGGVGAREGLPTLDQLAGRYRELYQTSL
jgi:ribokinase